jgi:hypothetical protein
METSGHRVPEVTVGVKCTLWVSIFERRKADALCARTAPSATHSVDHLRMVDATGQHGEDGTATRSECGSSEPPEAICVSKTIQRRVDVSLD